MRLFLKSIFLFSMCFSILQVKPVMATSIFDTVKSFFGGKKSDHIIFEVVEKDDVEQIRQIILNNPVVVHSRDSLGETPLHNADTAEVAQMLLDRGADVHAKNKTGETPLHYVRTAEVAQVLLDHGADVHAKDNYGNTLLHNARTAEVAQVLLDRGADVHAKDNYGNTLLHYVRTAEVAQVLLDHGADVHAKDNYGNTLLHNARTAEVAQVLLDRGLDVHTRNNSGETPLHNADTAEVAQVLLDHGADVNAKNNYKNTPLQVLMEKTDLFYNVAKPNSIMEKLIFEKLRLVSFLLKNGAKMAKIFRFHWGRIVEVVYFAHEVGKSRNDGLSFDDLEIIRKWVRGELSGLYLNDIKKALKNDERRQINSINPSKLLKALDARIAEKKQRGGTSGGGNCPKSFE